MLRTVLNRALTRLQVVRGDLHRNDRDGALHRSWGYVFTNHLVGDYYEFGVYQGNGLAASYRAYCDFLAWLDGQTRSNEPWRRKLARAYRQQHPARFIGLDTFAGMPANTEGEAIFATGTFAASEDDVTQRCARAGLVAPQLVLVAGPFAETHRQVHQM